MNYLGIEYQIKHAPRLDPGFIPFGIWSEAYRKDAKTPIAIAVEQTISYDTQMQTREDPEQILLPFMTNYVRSQMIGGKILTQAHSGIWVDGIYRIDGIYGCYEMIGRVRPEERLDEHEDH